MAERQGGAEVRKSIPRLLWLSIAALGIMTVWYLLMAFRTSLACSTVSRALSAHAALRGVSQQGQQTLARLESYSVFALRTAILSVLLLVGLALGRKWGYVLTLVYVLLAIALPFGQGSVQRIMAALIFVPVVVPMLICSRFFFPREIPGTAAEG
jgi:hypothetical protein